MRVSETTRHVLQPVMEGRQTVSDLLVMQSAAGWYVGQVCSDDDIGILMPYSRESHYMTEEQAIEYWRFLNDEGLPF